MTIHGKQVKDPEPADTLVMDVPPDVSVNMCPPRPSGVSADVMDAIAIDTAIIPMERELARKNLFFLAHHVLGYEDMDTVWHRKLCKIVTDSEQYRNRLFLVPRGTFKTTLLTISDSIRLALNNPNIRIAIMSNTGAMAQRILSEIRWHFTQNERLRHLFPEYAPDKNWGRKDSLTVPARTENYGEGTFDAIGADEHVVSKHYNVFKKDDLQDNKNANTQAQLENLNYWDICTRPLGYPIATARHDYIGTVWGYGDLYEKVEKRTPGLFKIERDAERGPDGEEGKLLCPTILPQEELDILRSSMSLSLYYSQYRMKRVNPDDEVFSIKDLEACKVQHCIQKESANFAVVVDPAFSKKKRSSDVAILGVGTDREGLPWLVDARIGKYNVHEVIQQIVDMAVRLDAIRVYVETISNQALGVFVEDGLRERGARATLKTISYHDRSKEMRIQRLEPLIRSHRLMLWEQCPYIDKIIEQFVMFPNGNLDGIDALAMAYEYAMPYLTPRSAPRPMTHHQRFFNELRKDNPNPMIIATHGRGRDCDPMWIDRDLVRAMAYARRN